MFSEKNRQKSYLGGLSGLFVLLFAAASAGAGDGTHKASGWQRTEVSAVRLLAVGNGRAGVEVVMPPGWHTYWRAVGQVGIPPEFDWSESAGIETVRVLWPVPEWIATADRHDPGYSGRVIFPVEVRRSAGESGARLRVKFRFGICAEVCVPVMGVLKLDLDSEGAPGVDRDIAAVLAAAFQKVPSTDFEAAGMEVMSLRRLETAAGPVIEATAHFSRKPVAPQLFMAASPWLIACGPARLGDVSRGKDPNWRAVLRAPACNGVQEGPIHVVLSENGRAHRKVFQTADRPALSRYLKD